MIIGIVIIIIIIIIIMIVIVTETTMPQPPPLMIFYFICAKVRAGVGGQEVDLNVVRHWQLRLALGSTSKCALLIDVREHGRV
jgi:hypothetical protein